MVPADGFFEWRQDGKLRIPFYIRPVPRAVITFAGLWERWRAPDGSWVLSYTIITGPPNELVAPLHDRMPMVVAPDHRSRWLDPGPVAPDEVRDILSPWPPASWKIDEVSTRVNKPANDDPTCIELVT